MNTERYERTIKIGGIKYPACYTVAAYLHNLKMDEQRGDITKLPSSEQHERILDMALHYINSAIVKRNMMEHKKDPLLTMDQILYLCEPEELMAIPDIVAEITTVGTGRMVRTQDEDEFAKKAEIE